MDSTTVPDDEIRPPRVLVELAEQLFAYGHSSDESLIDPLRAQYLSAVGQTSDEERLELLTHCIKLVEDRVLHPNVLNPFFAVDPSRRIIATATLHLAAVYPGTTVSDPLCGVRAIVELAERSQVAGDHLRAAAMLLGLIQIGDRRINTDLGPCWRGLSLAGRGLVAGVASELPKAATVDWLIDWLEDCEGGEYGIVAASLANHGDRATQLGYVVEIQRALPIWDVPEEEVIQVTQSWTRSAFAERIRDRLLRLALDEEGARVMPSVLRGWGIDVPANLDTAALPLTDDPATLLQLGIEQARGSLGTRGDANFIAPVDVAHPQLLANRGASVIVAWGRCGGEIPRLSMLGWVAGGEARDAYLWHGWLTPEAQHFSVIGFCRNLIADEGESCRVLLGAGITSGRVAPPVHSEDGFIIRRVADPAWQPFERALLGEVADRALEHQVSALATFVKNWRDYESVRTTATVPLIAAARVCEALNLPEVQQIADAVARMSE